MIAAVGLETQVKIYPACTEQRGRREALSTGGKVKKIHSRKLTFQGAESAKAALSFTPYRSPQRTSAISTEFVAVRVHLPFVFPVRHSVQSVVSFLGISYCQEGNPLCICSS